MEGSWRYTLIQRLNPFCWSERKIRLITVVFFTVFLPLYLFFGLQPSMPADATNLPILTIGSIELTTPVARLELSNGCELVAPASIAGSYSESFNKTLIIGHSTTVFTQLDELQLHEIFTYNDEEYVIDDISILAKADIDMREILAPASEETIVIMTCAGDPLPNQDATHRLILTATRNF